MRYITSFRKLRESLPHMSAASSLRYAYATRRNSPAECVHIRLRRFPGIAFEMRTRGSDAWTYEEIFVEEVYRPVVEALRSCGRILDIGANIGLSSLYFASHYPHASVLAVEANPPTFQLLDRNLESLRRQGRARTRCCAAWSRDGVVAADHGENSQHFSRFRVRAASGDSTAAGGIPARRVASLLDEAGWDWVDLIKIDIEGAEVELFADDPAWLRRTRCLAIEFHGESAAACGWPSVLERHGMKEWSSSASHTAIALRAGVDQCG
jgi:FkbM family methyltransferase